MQAPAAGPDRASDRNGPGTKVGEDVDFVIVEILLRRPEHIVLDILQQLARLLRDCIEDASSESVGVVWNEASSVTITRV